MTESLRLCSGDSDLEAKVIIMFLGIAITVCFGVGLGLGLEKLCEKASSKFQSL